MVKVEGKKETRKTRKLGEDQSLNSEKGPVDLSGSRGEIGYAIIIELQLAGGSSVDMGWLYREIIIV